MGPRDPDLGCSPHGWSRWLADRSSSGFGDGTLRWVSVTETRSFCYAPSENQRAERGSQWDVLGYMFFAFNQTWKFDVTLRDYA